MGEEQRTGERGRDVGEGLRVSRSLHRYFRSIFYALLGAAKEGGSRQGFYESFRREREKSVIRANYAATVQLERLR